MTEVADLTTDVLALGTIGAQVLTVLVIIAIVFRDSFREPLTLIRPYILPFVFVVTLAGSALTLVYSELFGMAPCFLCWLQRAAMYPIPVILGFAFWKGWGAAWKWVFGLSVAGAIIALYQHYLQMGGGALVACPAVPGAADCGQRLIFEFGYITFPLMAASIFVLVGLLMILYIATSRPSSNLESSRI